MNKFKLFIENFIVYGIGGIISKIIPLIMVPIVTSIMPNTEYYGAVDMSTTVTSFCSAIAIMGMYDAMYRLFFEKDDENYKKTICSTALLFTLVTSCIVFLLMIVFKDFIARRFFGDNQYSYIIYLSAMATLVGSTNSIISAPTRMQNKRVVFLTANIVSSFLSYSIAIPLLLAKHYIIALPLASIIAAITIEIVFYIFNKSWFSFSLFDSTILKELLKIALPLFPNFLVYWIFNSCDRVMITNLIGLGESGIYSVGAKFGHASQLIYTAFAGGWQYFAFSTMKESDQVKTNSMVFEYLGVISFVSTSFVCAFSYWFFRVVFKTDYLSAYIVAPYLFLSPLLQMLFQVSANQFLVIKKTYPNILILLLGAVLNIVINLYAIPALGIEGAAMATLAGYFVSNIICLIVLCKIKMMVVSKRFVASVLLMITYFVTWRLFYNDNLILGIMCAATFTLLICFMYFNDIRALFRSIKKG